ncbi:hypothetical protein DCCM_1048 [Desulfocucumis palustris]|uniref:PRC-barrel domain-containing protein n=1 Tax=Desulfocucumis palustris TaxID=1898651 RepID=A0A2L2X9X7_9FIRM|nr:PRC-barrel domain-containing protein [Desulfocucumis palustris]GBF32852.1 hypothetical protein DCCM_1048 [Desulfocucumis palustris]
MRKSKQFVSMPVISLAEGQQIGSIKGLVLNPVQKAVSALIIEQKGWFKEQKYIPFSKVRSIGEDALTIDRRSNAEKGASIPEIVELLKDRTEIAGAKLITENGTALGYVDEYYVDLQSGDIVGLEFSGGSISSWMRGSAFLDINHVLTIGKKVIVCSNEALENIIKMDGGLQEALRGIKDSTGSILSNTVQKTKEIGNNLNKTLEKVKRERAEKQDDNDDAAPQTPDKAGEPHENCHYCGGNTESPAENAPAENEPKEEKK